MGGLHVTKAVWGSGRFLLGGMQIGGLPELKGCATSRRSSRSSSGTAGSPACGRWWLSSAVRRSPRTRLRRRSRSLGVVAEVSRHPSPRAWVVRTALNTGASWWWRGAAANCPS